MIGALTLWVLAAPTWSVELIDCGPRKIEVIKVVRAATRLGLKEAKDLVEAAPKPVKTGLEKIDADDLAAQLSDAGAVVTVTNAQPKLQGRTVGQASVTLVTAGPRKIEVIQIVREATGLGLKDAKDLVEGAPKLVQEGLRAPDAQALADRLRKAGATVKVSGGTP